jgi:2-polyprenyl-3-methyl-5-hydroxy-6-metoxy-1,4-benzoquinol methylase
MTCRLCESTENKLLFLVKGYNIVKCANCGFVQVLDQPEQEQLDHLYEDSYFKSNKYRDTNTLNKELLRRLNLMRQYIPSTGACVLEAGCGTGEFISFAKNNYDMYGFDISEAAIKIAQERNPQLSMQLWAQKDEEYNLPAAFYDAICAWDVIEHLRNPVPTFQKLMKSLKPDGYLFISTPNIDAFVARKLGAYWAFMTPPEHLGFFNKKTMSFFAENHLHATLKDWHTRGKTVNVGFLLYKLGRVLPIVPSRMLKLFQTHPLSRLAIYVPTGDIQYVVIQKN